MTRDDEWVLLWRACVEGDPVAVERFCLTAYPFILAVFTRLTRDSALAADYAQDFFLSLFEGDGQRLKSFRPDLGVPLTSYLRLLALRKHIDRTRSRENKSRSREVSLAGAIETLCAGEDAERALMLRELREAVAELPPREREAVLWRLEGLRDGEIARLMGISAGGVGALLFRARDRLRLRLEGGRCDPRHQRGDPGEDR